MAFYSNFGLYFLFCLVSSAPFSFICLQSAAIQLDGMHILMYSQTNVIAASIDANGFDIYRINFQIDHSTYRACFFASLQAVLDFHLNAH